VYASIKHRAGNRKSGWVNSSNKGKKVRHESLKGVPLTIRKSAVVVKKLAVILKGQSIIDTDHPNQSCFSIQKNAIISLKRGGASKPRETEIEWKRYRDDGYVREGRRQRKGRGPNAWQSLQGCQKKEIMMNFHSRDGGGIFKWGARWRGGRSSSLHRKKKARRGTLRHL